MYLRPRFGEGFFNELSSAKQHSFLLYLVINLDSLFFVESCFGSNGNQIIFCRLDAVVDRYGVVAIHTIV